MAERTDRRLEVLLGLIESHEQRLHKLESDE